VSSRSGKMPGAEDCAPPTMSVGRGRVLAVRKNIGHRGLCPSHRVRWEGPRPRGPQGRADQGRLCRTCNHTRWLGALASPVRSGGTASPPSARMSGTEGLCPSHRVHREGPRPRGPQGKAEHGRLCRTCNHTRWLGALANPARSGRDGVPPVRNNTGHRGLCPSHRVGWEGPRPRGPQENADHGRFCGTCNDTRWPGALASSDKSGRDGVPAVRKNIGHRGLCPSHRVRWERPRPCGPQGRADHGRLYGTCNHTRWLGALASPVRSGGTASPRSGRIAGAEDCAPPWESPDRRHPCGV
jgi:hypothetical protein